jgi:hypothetical protein
MSLLDTYRRKLEVQIQTHKAHLELLKARVKHAAAQSEVELARADKHLKVVKNRFNELRGASGFALKDIRVGVKKALADLQASTKKAAAHFNSSKPRTAPRAKRRPAHRAANSAKSRKR